MNSSSVQKEIEDLENRLVAAELGPDPEFFREFLDDNAVMVTNGEAAFMKAKVVEAHVPGVAPKFTRVVMSEVQIIDHGVAAVVTCSGEYEHAMGIHKLKFMRTWVRKPEGWRIVAGTVS